MSSVCRTAHPPLNRFFWFVLIDIFCYSRKPLRKRCNNKCLPLSEKCDGRCAHDECEETSLGSV